MSAPDVGAMRAEANSLRACAEQLGQIAGRLDRRVATVTHDVYAGPAADRFRQAVGSHADALAQHAGALEHAAATLHRSADQVEEERRRALIALGGDPGCV